jgi:hypothetical protein
VVIAYRLRPLIRTHRAQVAGHIGGEDRGEAVDGTHFLPDDRLA